MKTIFIVEDDPDILELMQMIVQNDGYETVMFAKTDAVETSAAAQCPDLIIMDLFVDGVDGAEIVRKLKKNKKTSRIPVVLVSAKTSLARIAKECGAAGFLEKPFNIKDLTSLVKKLVK